MKAKDIPFLIGWWLLAIGCIALMPTFFCSDEAAGQQRRAMRTWPIPHTIPIVGVHRCGYCIPQGRQPTPAEAELCGCDCGSDNECTLDEYRDCLCPIQERTGPMRDHVRRHLPKILECLSGPNVPVCIECAELADFDLDCDVDFADIGILYEEFR